MSEITLWKEELGSAEPLGEGSGSRTGVSGGGCVGGDGALLRNRLDESLGGKSDRLGIQLVTDGDHKEEEVVKDDEGKEGGLIH